MTLHRAAKLGVTCCVILVLLLWMLSCARPTPSPTPTPPPTPTEPLSGTVEIKHSAFAFVPAEVTIKTGTEVVWTNNDAVSHTVTADGGLFDSGTMAKDASYSYTFTKAGTYTYYCGYHTYMKGKITVVE
ncbi:MAG: cupredoxin family copper-binding protein [Chloroflexi bacterium]|nr:cupredoxin family copper-binding protein [Chloroflexota bacterium]